MKSDIPALMQARNLDALLIFGNALHNPAMVYFTGVTHVTDAVLLVKRGEMPTLFFHNMERDEAAATGLQTRSITDYNYKDIFEKSGKDPLRATARLYQKMLADAGLISGRVAVYGQIDSGESYGLISGLSELMPNIEFVGEYGNSLLLQARATKDDAEIARMRTVTKKTTDVVARVAHYLASQRAKGDVLVDKDGDAVTVAKVKANINLWLAESGLENPHGTIFAPGAEGGVPHSMGSPDAVLRLGEPIVFDIFPVEAGGGFYADFTRTWCIGHASDAAQKLYDDVRHVYDTIMSEITIDTLCATWQARTCELFKAQGHATIADDPSITAGYVHSLAHGLGLDVHERPTFNRNATDEDILRPGSVVTIEPGLYYPERGLGMRLEDAVVMNAAGRPEILVPYPLDLVIPLKK
jgi:Xaa-Pro aminopeptidase